jgi:hypothetical protein
LNFIFKWHLIGRFPSNFAFVGGKIFIFSFKGHFYFIFFFLRIDDWGNLQLFCLPIYKPPLKIKLINFFKSFKIKIVKIVGGLDQLYIKKIIFVSYFFIVRENIFIYFMVNFLFAAILLLIVFEFSKRISIQWFRLLLISEIKKRE